MIFGVKSPSTVGLPSCFGISCLVEGMATALDVRESKVVEEMGLLRVIDGGAAGPSRANTSNGRLPSFSRGKVKR